MKMKLKEGDMVTCKDNDQCGGPGILTIGKEYKVVKVDGDFVWVINDEGYQDDFASYRFTFDSLSQHIRRIKEEIGI